MIDTNVPLYSIFIFLSFILNIIVICLLNKKKDKLVYYMLIYENIGFIYGGKLFTYLVNIKKYDSFNFFTLGFSSLGSLIGGILFLILFCIQFKRNIKETLSLFIKPIPLMYAVGKIGCFLVGCCYGIEYSGPFSIVYKYSMNDINGISLFPVQIVESIVFMIIFIITIVKKIDIYKLILMCSISKFLLDFLRFKNNNMILSVNQIGCLFIIIISLILIYKSNEKKKQI